MRYEQMIRGHQGTDEALVPPPWSPANAGVVSRRAWLRMAAGATVFGSAVGAGLLRSKAAAAEGPGGSGPGIGLAEPIPTTLNIAGVDVHVQAPPLTGPDTDPSTVTNFSGASAIAFISGLVDRHDRRTGETRTLPFQFTDMRFMQGEFRGRDGHQRDATFAFI
jgi:hypothetical protein